MSGDGVIWESAQSCIEAYVRRVTSAQYCCLVSESMCAKPPRTRAFIRDRCTELDSRWSGGLRLANCLARFHQLSHCTTMFALHTAGGQGTAGDRGTTESGRSGPHLSLFSTRVTSRSTVSLANSASELHTDRLLITFSSR